MISTSASGTGPPPRAQTGSGESPAMTSFAGPMSACPTDASPHRSRCREWPDYPTWSAVHPAGSRPERGRMRGSADIRRPTGQTRTGSTSSRLPNSSVSARTRRPSIFRNPTAATIPCERPSTSSVANRWTSAAWRSVLALSPADSLIQELIDPGLRGTREQPRPRRIDA